MSTYSNGNVPRDLLIAFASGYDDLGYWEHQWPAHTLALGNALIERAAARRAAAGLAPYPLRLQTGWTAYRPYEWQKTYRAILGNGAADPGTSSHGGTFEGGQTMAGDWAWQAVYRDCGGREAFFEDCRAVGLLPGMIMASRGYPDEDWHVIDPDPWGPIPAFADSRPFMTPIDYALLRRQKENTMYIKGASQPEIYAVYTDINGHVAMRVCGFQEGQYAIAGGLLIQANDEPLTAMGVEAGYQFGVNPPTVAAQVWAIAPKSETGIVDVDELAKQIRTGLGAEVVAALVKQLAK